METNKNELSRDKIDAIWVESGASESPSNMRYEFARRVLEAANKNSAPAGVLTDEQYQDILRPVLQDYGMKLYLNGESVMLDPCHYREIIDRALATRASVDLSGLTRYEPNIPMGRVETHPDGDYYKVSDVRALLATSAAEGGEQKCQWPSCQPEHVQQEVAAQGYRELYSSEQASVPSKFGSPELQALIVQHATASVPSVGSIDICADLREYASNPGYSHNDYADTMKKAAHCIESLRAMIFHYAPAAQMGSAQAVQADVRDAAMEEAAKVCTIRARNWHSYENEPSYVERGNGAEICAQAIRALKRTSTTAGEGGGK